MAKATFDHCCCCIELRLGCLIWGYLELNNRALVGAYLLYTFVFIIVGLVTMVSMVGMLATLDKLKIPGAVIGLVVVGISLTHLFMAYFWLVIRSQYCNMEIKPNPAVNYRPEMGINRLNF